MPALACEINFACGWFEQSAEHLDRRRLARAVCAEQAIDFAVADFEVDVLHGLEVAKLFAQIGCADGDYVTLSFSKLARLWKRRRARLAAKPTQQRDERIFQRWRHRAHRARFDALRCECFACDLFTLFWIAHHHVEPVAEALHVVETLRVE